MRKSAAIETRKSVGSSENQELEGADALPLDLRARRLLEIFCEIEDYEDILPESEFSELLYRAALACGFADELEACEALAGFGFTQRMEFPPPKSTC